MVSVANFSSVLEIAFSLSFLFFIFEISPRIKRHSRPLLNNFRKLHLWRILRAGKANRTWKDFANLMWKSVAAAMSVYALWLIEGILLLYTLGGAFCSLGLLIASGYNPSLCLQQELMTIILLFLFGLLPIYLIEYFLLYLLAQRQLRKVSSLISEDSFY